MFGAEERVIGREGAVLTVAVPDDRRLGLHSLRGAAVLPVGAGSATPRDVFRVFARDSLSTWWPPCRIESRSLIQESCHV